MRNNKPFASWLAVLTVFCLLAAACGDDDNPEEPDELGDAGSGDTATTTIPLSDDPDDPAGTSGDPANQGTVGIVLVPEEGELQYICPSPLVIQTDWWPESEYGFLYNLIGDGYEVDIDNKLVRGPMVLNGVELGIDFEIRSGGPAIAFATVASHMYTDEGIHLGFASTDSQILQWESAPVVSVVAPIEKNPQMIMWDPETYPDVESIADLGDRGITVNVFSATRFPDILVAQGVLSADQIDTSYTGTPARFIAADGEIAQQGFASSEVFTYEHIYEDWAKPVKFQLLHDAGYQIYSQTVGVRRDMLESSEVQSCLKQVVPIIQQSTVSFIEAPDRANEIIVDVVEKYNSSWVYDADLANFAVQALKDYGLLGNGSDSTVGNIEGERIQKLFDAIMATDLASDVSTDLSPEDIYTNEFINPGIGF